MLKDPPLLTLRRTWQRPDAFMIGRFKGVQTGQAVDAMQGRGALDSGIKAVDPANATFLGTAVTCETGPNTAAPMSTRSSSPSTYTVLIPARVATGTSGPSASPCSSR